jgi:hypothetical protein
MPQTGLRGHAMSRYASQTLRRGFPRTRVNKGRRKNGSLTHWDFTQGVGLLAHHQLQTTPPGEWLQSRRLSLRQLRAGLGSDPRCPRHTPAASSRHRCPLLVPTYPPPPLPWREVNPAPGARGERTEPDRGEPRRPPKLGVRMACRGARWSPVTEGRGPVSARVCPCGMRLPIGGFGHPSVEGAVLEEDRDEVAEVGIAGRRSGPTNARAAPPPRTSLARALQLSLSARNSSHVRRPTACSGARLVPDRNTRAALPGSQSGTIGRR